MSMRRLSLALGSLGALYGAGRAEAQTPTAPNAAGTSLPTTTQLWHQSTLLGDAGGLRTVLGDYGVSLGLQETDEVFGNLSGGIHRGATFDGLTLMSLGLDTGKAFGWAGGTFNVSALQIHGRSLSADNLLNLNTVSGIEAARATRLWELWYQQAFLNGKADIKVGQQSIDQEFMTSQGSSLFINTMMGWPALPSYDMPAGGPAYPLSAPGVRFRLLPSDSVAILAGVFNGDPTDAGRSTDASGTRFALRNGVLGIMEVQYAINQPALGDMVGAAATQGGGLPGTYKLGVWYNSESFDDQQRDTLGQSVASLLSDGVPGQHRGDFSVYAVADQMVWRPDAQSTRSLNVFLRAMGEPDEQNLISFSVNGGATLKAPFAGRDNDAAGLGFGYTRVSSRDAALDRDTAAATGADVPTRTGEAFLELTYQYQISPWWLAQPDLQYIINTGGGVARPDAPGKKIGNAAVLGLRTSITF